MGAQSAVVGVTFRTRLEKKKKAGSEMVLPFLLSTFQSVIMNSAIILPTKISRCNVRGANTKFAFGSELGSLIPFGFLFQVSDFSPLLKMNLSHGATPEKLALTE